MAISALTLLFSSKCRLSDCTSLCRLSPGITCHSEVLCNPRGAFRAGIMVPYMDHHSAHLTRSFACCSLILICTSARKKGREIIWNVKRNTFEEEQLQKGGSWHIMKWLAPARDIKRKRFVNLYTRAVARGLPHPFSLFSATWPMGPPSVYKGERTKYSTLSLCHIILQTFTHITVAYEFEYMYKTTPLSFYIFAKTFILGIPTNLNYGTGEVFLSELL